VCPFRSRSCRFGRGVRILCAGPCGIIALGRSRSLSNYVYFARRFRNRVVVPHLCRFGLLFFLLFARAASGIGHIGRIFLVILLLLRRTGESRIHRQKQQNRESWPCALHRSSPEDKFRSSMIIALPRFRKRAFRNAPKKAPCPA